MAQELIIPLRMDIKEIFEKLDGVRGAGKKAGDEIAGGMEKADKASKKAADSAGSLLNAFAGIGIARQRLDLVMQVSRGIGESMNRAAEFTEKCAEQFITIQKTMQGIAALSNKQNTNQFTLEQVQKAAGANLTPKDFVSSKEKFLEKSKINIGPGKNISEEEADKYVAAVAEWAKLNRVDQSEAAELTGTLLNQQKGPTNAADMTAKAGKVFETLWSGGKGVGGQQITGFNRLVGQGMSAEEAAPAMAMMASLGVGRNDAQSLMALRADIHRLEVDKKKTGEAGKFGIGGDQTETQKIIAVVATLRDQTGASVDRKRLDALLDEITSDKMGQRVLRSLVEKEPRYAEKFQNVYETTPDDRLEKQIEAGRQSSAGRVMRTEAHLKGVAAGMAVKFTDVEDLKKEAEARLTEWGVFSEAHLSDYGLRQFAAGLAGQHDVRKQRINEEAIQIAQGWARVPKDQRGMLISMGANQKIVDEILCQQLEHAEQQTEHLETIAAAVGAPVLSTPPANAPGRMAGH
jgi:hypothetical protein